MASDQEVVHAAVGQHGLHAPAHVDVEVVNALRGLVLGRHLTRPRARDALRDLDDLQIHRWPLDHRMAGATLDLLDTVTPYDAAGVVLAQGLGCPLVTRDKRLGRAVREFVAVRMV
ncbi:type II toxin-antitoxin system VapC family toxin [Ornithinimicrobium sp. F0845]|uniref:type II toxin-antitoxin system VapC family toxin n=1 Tax=Ornithinimicrobium sp. F0845 TaxID=2926412 RepID=UPI001FF42396|nr:type II toxin-antitoxin system VapC family toxin [Ornithinimicrobium sp. F0845]MCK0112406.1 type II toxin-antitoxin system VapC family toxin [Ornithinimicrobium sp. F0845]